MSAKFEGHTPGPWEVLGKQGTCVWAGNEIIAQMTNPRSRHRQARADAVLMASAPALLAENERLRARVAELSRPVDLVWHEGSGFQLSQEFEHGQYEIRGNLVAGYYGLLRHAKAGALWLSSPAFVPAAEAKAACQAHHEARYMEMQRPARNPKPPSQS